MVIYKITNIINSKIYIGSTVCFSQRKKQHLKGLRKNSHHNYKLQNDYCRHGECSFVFEVIEKGYRDKQTLLIREYQLINSVKEQLYNIDKVLPILPKEKKPIKKSFAKKNFDRKVRGEKTKSQKEKLVKWFLSSENKAPEQTTKKMTPKERYLLNKEKHNETNKC